MPCTAHLFHLAVHLHVCHVLWYIKWMKKINEKFISTNIPYIKLENVSQIFPWVLWHFRKLIKPKEKVGRNQNTEKADENTGQQPVFANGIRKGTGYVAALCDLILSPGITVLELSWMEDTQLVFIGEPAVRWTALCVMREAHRCLARWIWAGLEDSETEPLHHQQPVKQPWICSMLITGQENRIGVPFLPLGEQRFTEHLLWIWCSWRLPNKQQRHTSVLSSKGHLDDCQSAGQESPIEKAAWSRCFRIQCKACLVCRLTQQSDLLVIVFSHLLSRYNIANNLCLLHYTVHFL